MFGVLDWLRNSSFNYVLEYSSEERKIEHMEMLIKRA